MLLDRIAVVESLLRAHLRDRFQIELGSLAIERPPRAELGDLAFPFPFELAKTLRRPPRKIAEEIADSMPVPDGVAKLEAAGAGYINLFFERSSFLSDLYGWLLSPAPASRGAKVIVEHTNINPNKAAHIGHLRNAALGDTLVRLLRSRGRSVEVQNYIDNTGVQVADVVVGFQQLRRLGAVDVAGIPDPFDFYCWDLYAQVSEWYASDEANLEYRRTALRKIEEGKGETAELAEVISNRIVKAHLKTMDRIGVRYQVLPRESEILQLKFWEEAFVLLKERQAIQFITDGPQKGCWVMRLPGENGQQNEEKIIVRSNGTVTYVGKDIAYQMWKFGLLRNTFHYRAFYRYPDGETVWSSTAEGGDPSAPEFGNGHRVYNVIDARQSYLQRVVVQGLRSLGFEDEASRSTHFSYEMVALSPACCEELNMVLSPEDRARPYVEVSGRKGLGVKADDLLDKLIEKSLTEVKSRRHEMTADKQLTIARQIAVGALRYFLLKYVRNSVIAFDFAEALSFEGETGPYLQYSVVRSENIFRKLAQRNPEWNREEWRLTRPAFLREESLADLLEDHEIWSLLLQIARIEDVVEQSIHSLELSGVAKHAFTLAQQFNLFYHKYHILSEENTKTQDFYLTVAETARLGLLRILDLLGIEVPDRM